MLHTELRQAESFAVGQAFLERRDSPGFRLRDFVDRHFAVPAPIAADVPTHSSHTLEDHVRAVWDVLARPRTRTPAAR